MTFWFGFAEILVVGDNIRLFKQNTVPAISRRETACAQVFFKIDFISHLSFGWTSITCQHHSDAEVPYVCPTVSHAEAGMHFTPSFFCLYQSFFISHLHICSYFEFTIREFELVEGEEKETKTIGFLFKWEERQAIPW